MSTPVAVLRRRVRTRELRVAGEKLVGKVKELVREGNVRRITVKDARGRPVLEIPLNVGAAGVVLRPTWVALAAIGALASRHTLAVERVE